jgi:hypothetical protein
MAHRRRSAPRQKSILLALIKAVQLIDNTRERLPDCARGACSSASQMSFTPPSPALMVM